MYELLDLFFLFFRIGALTFGGGMAIVPLIQQELSERGMMTLAESVNVIAISESTPGPFAVNAATFVGMRLYGIPGAVFATLGVVGPSVIIMFVVARFFFRLNRNPVVQSVLSGVRPVVLALIASAAATVVIETVFGGLGTPIVIDWPVLGLALACTGALVFTRVNPIALIAGCGAVGAVWLR